ncbi:MAG TPA: N-acetylmuramoyl-L-alanine amidase [Planctomycetaceae bacterium]|nr:N-acetylmuramoyl-L-alanine amidase [Planctomycetaceae bacterium]
MFDRVDYVSLTDVARELDLKLTPGDRGRSVVLSDGPLRAEIETDNRDITVNGLRVFLGEPSKDAAGQIYVSRIDYERCLTPLLRPGQGVALRAEPKTIVLDPGHGGRDNGTSVHEKTFALDVARSTEKLLVAAGYRVLLTRTEDRYVDLKERALLANANRADLYVSIHFNALEKDNRTSGFEIYTFPPAKQHASEWWSRLRPGDPDLETEDEPVNRFDHWSVVLAQQIHRRFVVDLKAFDRGTKLKHLGTLRGLNCPGVLVECGFLTSEVEARKIATPEYREKLARAIADGVSDYAATLKLLAARN